MLKWTLPADWRQVRMGVARDNFLGTVYHLAPQPLTGVVIHLYPKRTIRPGESLDTNLFIGAYVCGDESWPCRKIFVDLGGAPVDLELIPLDGQGALVSLAPEWPEGFVIRHRLTVNTSEIFIYGNPGRVQLRASRSAQ